MEFEVFCVCLHLMVTFPFFQFFFFRVLQSCFLVFVIFKVAHQRMLRLLDVHLFSQDDIDLNGVVVNWPSNIAPVFDENEMVRRECSFQLLLPFCLLQVQYCLFAKGLNARPVFSLNENWKCFQKLRVGTKARAWKSTYILTFFAFGTAYSQGKTAQWEASRRQAWEGSSWNWEVHKVRISCHFSFLWFPSHIINTFSSRCHCKPSCFHFFDLFFSWLCASGKGHSKRPAPSYDELYLANLVLNETKSFEIS